MKMLFTGGLVAEAAAALLIHNYRTAEWSTEAWGMGDWFDRSGSALLNVHKSNPASDVPYGWVWNPANHPEVPMAVVSDPFSYPFPSHRPAFTSKQLEVFVYDVGY